MSEVDRKGVGARFLDELQRWGALPFTYVVTRLAIRLSRSGEPVPTEP